MVTNEQDPSVPRARRRGLKVGVALASVVAVAALTPPVRATLKQPTPGYDAPAASIVVSYHCSSSVSETDESYTIVGTVPAEVPQGSTFTLSDVVITGTPSVDLLLVSLTVNLVAPIGATSVDGLSRTILGPGSTDPVGPVAPAGTPNSSPPLSFQFVASGPVGTTVDFHSGTVASVVADIANPSVTVPVTCTRTGGGAFANTRIIEVTPNTLGETTTTTADDPTKTTIVDESTTTTTTLDAGVGSESGTDPNSGVLAADQSNQAVTGANPLFAG